MFGSKTALALGLSYNQIETQTDYIRLNNVFTRNYKTTKINIKALNIKISIQYNFNQIRRKVNLHFINSLLLNSKNAYLRIDEEGESNFLYSDLPTQTSQYEVGFGIDAGLNYNISQNSALVIKVGYERIGDFIETSEDRYPSDSFTLKLGYSFDL